MYIYTLYIYSTITLNIKGTDSVIFDIEHSWYNIQCYIFWILFKTTCLPCI